MNARILLVTFGACFLCQGENAWAGISSNRIDFSSKNRMVIFGDSLSDFGNTGTVNSAYQNWSDEADAVLPDVPGWPEPFSGDYRFSNGNMWSVYFSQMVNSNNNSQFQVINDMGAARALPYNPYFEHAAEPYDDILGYNVGGVQTSDYSSDPSSNGSTHQNWAWGGAQTDTSPLVTTDFVELEDGYFLSSVSKQISSFSSTGNTFDSQTVAFLWAGANDYILYTQATSPMADLAQHMQDFPTEVPPNLGQTAAANQLANIQSLIDQGAEDIVLMNLPDIGKTPGAIAGDFDEAALLLSPSQYVQDFNNALSDGLDDLIGDANIILVDIYAALNDIIANPEDYGLNPDYIQESVILNENDETSIFHGLEFNDSVTQSEIDDNDFSGWLFWDHVHPTESGHQLLGQTIYQTAVVPEPASGTLLGTAVLTWAALRRKRRRDS